MTIYHLEISITPDSNHPHAPYFWCILKLVDKTWVNDGFGWSINPEKAWDDANKYHQKNYL
jgi:hypothetical protein